MIIRTKGGEFQEADSSVLLDFLGVKKEAVGLHKVSADVLMMAGVPFSVSSEQLAVSSEKGFAWTLSTYDLDRYGERIDPAGWDFSQYLKNPVVQWAHCFHIPAIGKVEALSIDDKGLHGVVVFNDREYDQLGWSIGQRIKNGSLKAGSVGFRVLEIEIPDKKTAQDGTTLIFRKQELLEFSICNVPANPYALTKLRMSNEELAMSNEIGSNAVPFWGGLIQF